MKNRRFISLILYVLMLLAVFSWAGGFLESSLNPIPYSQVVELFYKEQVKAFVVGGDTISMELYVPYEGPIERRLVVDYIVKE